ncbi:GNAT family N-acetyltransferase [Poriferisphaera sp. WC338]|uniref:GNAT family N-acetyltransferase n=1 Tax=Poriferisphaera sp. WC338 TaxID=3425129 RepID=UPI003D8176EE
MIEYEVNKTITAEQYVDLLKRSTLGERRPIDDMACIEGMVRHSNLFVSAWEDGKLIGASRSMTDFHYACYLSDLAVDQSYQRRGIGKRLQQLTQDQLGPQCSLILLAAPKAKDYYAGIGYARHERCWILEPTGVIAD